LGKLPFLSPMKIEQVAIQLYTLRDFCQTEADFAQTLARVRKIGYRGIQLSNHGPIAPERIRAIAKENDLIICATHQKPQMFFDEPEAVVQLLDQLGTKLTAYPFPAGVDLSKEEEVSAMIAKLNTVGAMLAKAGQVLMYHNHALELYKLNGKMVLERIFEETDPAFLQGELDTYWIAAGGQNPAKWLEKLSGRHPLLHLKDYAVTATGAVHETMIGAGNLDFKEIIAAADTAGVEWFAVEQDSVQPGEEPFDCITRSFNYIAENLVS